MFGIPGKQAVTMTDKAAAQISKLMQKDGHKGLRIGVKKGGCAGMEYTMAYVDEVDPLDEIVEQDGARVMIAPMARCSCSARKLTIKSISWSPDSNLTTPTFPRPVAAANRSNSTKLSPRTSSKPAHKPRSSFLRRSIALSQRNRDVKRGSRCDANWQQAIGR